jgi:hypothetical protein
MKIQTEVISYGTLEEQLTFFEKEFGMPTFEFVERFRAGEIQESPEAIEWESIASLLEARRQKSIL